MTDPLMNCLVCLASDCGIYYRPEANVGWAAHYQCSSCERRAEVGYGSDKKGAAGSARLNWQAENAPETTLTKPAGE